MIPIIDVIFIVVIFGFVLTGWLFGFIHTLGSLVGTILGIVIASRVAGPVGEFLGGVFGGQAISSIVAFIVIFLIVSRLVGFLFWTFEKAFKLMKIIPFISSIDKILGVVLGFLEGVVVLGAVLFFAAAILPEEMVVKVLDPSVIQNYLLNVFNIFIGLVPESLKEAVNL